MKIYRLDFDVNNYKSIQLCDKVDGDFYQMFDGERLEKKWTIPDVCEYEEDIDLLDGDAPGFIIPVLNKRALDLLWPIIKGDVEVLPLNKNGELLYGINVLSIIDAVDYELSTYRTYRDGKRIMSFKKISFKEDKVNDTNIFKVIDLKRGDIYVSEEFYNAVIKNNLKGFKMIKVYG